MNFELYFQNLPGRQSTKQASIILPWAGLVFHSIRYVSCIMILFKNFVIRKYKFVELFKYNWQLSW